VNTTGPFAASLLGPGTGSPGGTCSSECAAEVTFTPPAGAAPGSFGGSVTYQYADGSQSTLQLDGHYTTAIPPACTVTGARASLSAGLKNTPRTAATALTLTGHLTGCVGAGVTTKYPLTRGTFRVVGSLPAGATCSTLNGPTFSSSTASVTWQGVNPITHALVTLGTDAARVSALAGQTLPVPGWALESTPDASARALFPGTTELFGLTLIQSAARIRTLCASTGGLKALTFDGTGGSDVIVR
jgi:hypothetical protein